MEREAGGGRGSVSREGIFGVGVREVKPLVGQGSHKPDCGMEIPQMGPKTNTAAGEWDGAVSLVKQAVPDALFQTILDIVPV